MITVSQLIRRLRGDCCKRCVTVQPRFGVLDNDRKSTESFEEFKDSFSYGSRNDLSFKFMKRLSEADAAEFIRQVLGEIGEMLDDASSDRLLDLVYEWQVRAYTPAEGAKRPYLYDDRPFGSLAKPLAETTVGLLSSSGHYVADNDPSPFGTSEMTQEQAIDRIDDFLRETPELSEIPSDVDDDALRVRHPGYDIRSASRDASVALPRGLLLDAEREGRIGHLASVSFSFVGACSQGRLRKELDGWFERWDTQGIEALFLVPV